LIEDLKGRAGIQRQIALPLRQSLRMTKNSIFIRMGRSIITSAGIFLGIAFMCSVFAGKAVEAGRPAAEGSIVVESGQEKYVWLVAIALVVATIGIINSMLMAVSERYKEIGTMKCLGALDSLVVRLFLLESGLLGLLGAIAGAIVGTGFGLLMQAARQGWGAVGEMGPALAFRVPSGGWAAVVYLAIVAAIGFVVLRWLYASLFARGRRTALGPGAFALVGAVAGVVAGFLLWRDTLSAVTWHPQHLSLWACVGLSIVLGMVLAVLAAVYPAQQAAKMPPAAALRVEI
jgi:putative ABC transport system permease protein